MDYSKLELVRRLMAKGYTLERARDIVLEAIQSSNPEYVLNYYGLKV